MSRWKAPLKHMELCFTWQPDHAKLYIVIIYEVGFFHYSKVVYVYCAQTQLFDIAIQLFALVILLIIAALIMMWFNLDSLKELRFLVTIYVNFN